MRFLAVTAVTLSLALIAHGAAVAAEERANAPGFRVIVHPGNPVTRVDRTFLEDAFLKRTARWPNGEPIRPVDLSVRSSARSRFSQEVLRRSVQAVKAYWQQRIFSGANVPPPEFDSDEDVVEFVLEHAGAVGYVSAGTDLRGSRPITVQR